MFCPKCGTQLADGSVFCSSCGANLKTGAAPKAAGTSIFNLGKKVTIDTRDFAFAVLAAVLVLLASFLMHTSIISSEYFSGASMEITVSSYDAISGEEASAGAIMGTISTIFTFLSVAYLLLPFFLNKFMKLNFINWFVPALMTFFNFLIVLISLIGIGADANGEMNVALCGWLFYLCAAAGFGICVWQGVMALIKKK